MRTLTQTSRSPNARSRHGHDSRAGGARALQEEIRITTEIVGGHERDRLSRSHADLLFERMKPDAQRPIY
jgi:hypothetical protein